MLRTVFWLCDKCQDQKPLRESAPPLSWETQGCNKSEMEFFSDLYFDVYFTRLHNESLL